MFQVSKLLRLKVLSTNMSEFSHSAVQLVDKVDFMNLYVCLVVHTDAKLQQDVCL